MISSYFLWCPEQKQPNERVCTIMEEGSSFGEIDNNSNISKLQILNCKNRCHLFSNKISRNQIGGQKEDKIFCR